MNRLWYKPVGSNRKTSRGLSLVAGLLALLLGGLVLNACAEEPTAAPAGSSRVEAVSRGQPLPTPTPPGPETRKVLTIWTGGWKGNTDYEKFLNDQIDRYRLRNPGMTVDWQDWGADLATRFDEAARATGPARTPPPDIVLFGESDLYQFGALGFLHDITALGGSNLQDDYVPATFEALRYGSVFYGLPWLARTRVSIINKKLWQQATLDPAKPPRTFTELEPMIPLMVSKTPADVIPVWFKPDPLVDFMMEDTVVYNLSGDGKAKQTAFPSPGTIEKWRYIQEKRRRQGVFHQDGLAKSYADALNLYAGGKLVMVMDGAPLLPGLKNKNSELYNNTLVVPHLVGRGNVLPLEIEGWAISKKSARPEEALAFLKFLNSPENQLAFARFNELRVPTLNKALLDPYITGQDDPLAQARSIMAASLARSRAPEQLLPAPLAPSERDRMQEALNKAQARVWNENIQPRDALAEAARVWDDVFSKGASKP